MSHENKEFASILEETARGVLFIFSGSVIATILSALCGIIIARLLGPELYGLYSLTFTVAGFLSIFTGLGVNYAFTKYLSQMHHRRIYAGASLMLKTGLIFTSLEALVISLIGVLFARELSTSLVNRPDLTGYVAILLPTVIAQALVNAASGALLGFGDAKRTAYISIIQQVFRLFLAPGLILLGLGLAGALIGNTLAYLIATIPAIIYVYRYYVEIKRSDMVFDTPLSVLVRMLVYGAPLYISSVISTLVDTYRNSILARIASDYVIGSFNVAYRFVTLITIILAPISTMLFPAFSRLSDNSEDLKKLFTLAIKYTALIVVPATIFTIVMSRELVVVLFGREYLELTPRYFALIAVNYLYTVVGYVVLSSFFSGIGATRINLVSTIVYAICFTISAPLLSMLLGVDGLAYSIILANGASMLYTLKVASRNYNVKPDYKVSTGILMVSIVSAVPIILLTYTLSSSSTLLSLLKLLIGGTLYLVVYVTLLPVTRLVKKSDIEFIYEAFSRIKPLKPIVTLLVLYEEKLLGAIYSR